ncbi:MAG TPA: hypothetical protein VIK04_02355 [Solirubrobacteraceae bacterium]
MTLITIGNIVFAAFVLIAIPGMIAWAIHSSPKDEARAVAAAARRSRRRGTIRHGAATRRPAPRTGAAAPWAS